MEPEMNLGFPPGLQASEKPGELEKMEGGI